MTNEHNAESVAVPRRQMEQWIEMLRAVRPGSSDASTRQTYRQIKGQLQRLIDGSPRGSE